MKEAWKKSLKYLIVLPIIVIAVVVVILTLPKGESTPLSVTAKDVVLEIGDSENISYDVNIKQAVVSFKVEDETKANVNSSEKKIVGLSEGKTNLIVTAKYGNETSVVTVSVTVLGAPSTDAPDFPTMPENPTTPNNPSTPEDDEQGKNIKFIVDNNEVNELVLTVGESASFRVECEENNITIQAPSEVEIKKITTGTYSINVATAGYYTITIQTPLYQRTLEVIVN